MDSVDPFRQVSYAFQKSLGLWLTFWAIRFGTGVDYKLSAQGRTVRWSVVILSFALTSLPGASIGWFRVIALLAGESFLCWPNLAYYLNRLFETWPTTEGRILSIQPETATQWQVSYDSQVNGMRCGGQGRIKVDAHSSISNVPSEEKSVIVQFDPLNPERSSRIQQVVSASSRLPGSHVD